LKNIENLTLLSKFTVHIKDQIIAKEKILSMHLSKIKNSSVETFFIIDSS